MDYIELKIELSPIEPARDILMHELGETGFESFTEEVFGLLAYIPQNTFNEERVNEILDHTKTYTEEVKFSQNIIEQQNWNEVWESNFEPIKIGTKCLVKAPFHTIDEKFDYEIVISPKMSFGTGHHETTFLMLSELFEMELKDNAILDMGSGTAILAILASKLNAKTIDAIDVEEWAFENAAENADLNTVSNITPLLGDASLIEDKNDVYDVVLANINRNILVQDMKSYAKALKVNGDLLLSGFYEVDADILIAETSKYGLKLKDKKVKNNWCMLHFER